ncbi:MAG: hypothetical protein L0271_05705 [Gemmatimonadetes bacterium]|nr:hypothetical protein [Gemmatimonadota bacterium]
MSKRVPIVRNTAGRESAFSVDRYARDAVTRGDPLDAARAAARQLLSDLQHADVTVATTDAIRHWILERDPSLFTLRACVRVRDAAGTLRYVDPALGSIAREAELASPVRGPFLAELFIDYFRPGAGNVLFQDAGDSGGEEKPPDLADLERDLGDLVNRLEFPDTPDFTGTGESGKRVDESSEDPLPKRFHLTVDGGGLVRRFSARPGIRPVCAEPYLLFTKYYMKAPGCAGVNYRALVRAGLLQAAAEAFRLCRPSGCTTAMIRLIHVSWACGSDLASAFIQFEVVCTGD